MQAQTMKTPPIVSTKEWNAAWEQMLAKEKALMRARDALAAERRRMPWMAVEKAYAFDGPGGRVSLLDLFEGRHQLIVYRAFFEPGVHGWPEHACIGCSLGAEQACQLRAVIADQAARELLLLVKSDIRVERVLVVWIEVNEVDPLLCIRRLELPEALGVGLGGGAMRADEDVNADARRAV